MDNVCVECGALYWEPETRKDGVYTGCCADGEVKLDSIPEPAPEIKRLFTGASDRAKEFRSHIRP